MVAGDTTWGSSHKRQPLGFRWDKVGGNPFPRRVVQPQQKEMGRRAARFMGTFGEVIQQTESPSQAIQWENQQNLPVRFKPGANLKIFNLVRMKAKACSTEVGKKSLPKQSRKVRFHRPGREPGTAL